MARCCAHHVCHNGGGHQDWHYHNEDSSTSIRHWPRKQNLGINPTISFNSRDPAFRYWPNGRCPLEVIFICRSCILPCRIWVPICLSTPWTTWMRDSWMRLLKTMLMPLMVDFYICIYPSHSYHQNYFTAPKITSKITEVRWSQQTSMELFARYRALYGFKNLTTSFLGKAVQLLELKPLEIQLPTSTLLAPGSFYFHRLRKSLMIGCAQKTQLEVLQLRVEGKKPMSAHDFNNGFLKRAQSLQFTQNKLVNC